MTTINSSSPASVWIQTQTKAAETATAQNPVVNSSTAPPIDSVQISEAAQEKLKSETAASTEPQALPPPIGSTVMPLGNGSGNDPPVDPPIVRT